MYIYKIIECWIFMFNIWVKYWNSLGGNPPIFLMPIILKKF